MEAQISRDQDKPGVDDYIGFAEFLKLRCQQLLGVDGVGKLERKINAEIRFLQSLKTRDRLSQETHLQSSNLSHFSSLLHAAEHLPGLVQVLPPFASPCRGHNLVVDLVAANGQIWVKVIARKSQALHLILAGQGQFGDKDLVSQARDYLTRARQHPCQFKTPQVHFAFYNQVTQPMADQLRHLGVVVWGQVVPVEGKVLRQLTLSLGEELTLGSQRDDVTDGPASTDTTISVTAKNDACKTGEESPNGSYCCGRCPVGNTCTWSANSLSANISSDSDSSLSHSIHDTGENSCNWLSGASMGASENREHLFSGIDCCVGSALTVNTGLQPDTAQLEVSRPIPRVGIRVSTEGQSKPACDLPNIPHKIRANSFSDQKWGKLFLRLISSPPVYDLDPGLSTLLPGETSSSTTPVNLDITSLIALVSSVTNGNCHFLFRDKVLSDQAREEMENPVLPTLQKYLEGKQLISCETAVSSFRSILAILGGPSEKRRAEDLLARVTEVKDEPSPRALALGCQGRIKERSKIIFGTGDTWKAVTMTSNMGFVRAAQGLGVVFPTFLHPARALTEEKEQSAVPLLGHASCDT